MCIMARKEAPSSGATGRSLTVAVLIGGAGLRRGMECIIKAEYTDRGPACHGHATGNQVDHPPRASRNT